MELIKQLINLFLHIDKNLLMLIENFGGWSYGILAGVLFMETGLVVTPFLPGDSLLFAAGALAARGAFNVVGLYFLLFAAVLLGDNVNYWVGRFIGPRAFSGKVKFLKKEYLDKTETFYEKYGPKAVILARFVPIIRTFAPFVAGVGKMKYPKFIGFSVLGAFFWVTLFIWGGYFLGNFPIIKENFHYMVLLIIAVSVMPIVFEVMKSKRK
ncbi:MAG: DedA family protein [Candidatus Shapirobacteria bacterium]